MLHSSYFLENESTANYLIHLVNTMVSTIGIIILQLLCAVPASLNRVMALLAFDGMSLNSLSPEERARSPTVLAFDELFKDFTERIVVFNCRDSCVEDTKTGRCCKCRDYEGAALADAYLVLGQLAKDIGTPISFVSMAGTTSKIRKMISPKLESSNLFNVVFGNGYHLSLLAYPAIMCFKFSFLNQVSNVTSSVIDLFSLLGKTHLLPGIFENERLCMVRSMSSFSDADLAESELRVEISRIFGRKEYQRQVEFGFGIGGATHEQRSEWTKKGGKTTGANNVANRTGIMGIKMDGYDEYFPTFAAHVRSVSC